MTDPIADLLTRIRNGYNAHLDDVKIPYSNQKSKIVDVLVSQGYLNSVSVTGEKVAKQLVVSLKYVGKYPALSKIERISTPGRRVYSSAKEIKPVLGGNGVRIISTNKGIMIDT